MRSYKSRTRAGRRREGKKIPFYPNQVYRVLMAIMAAITVTSILAVVFPLPLDRIADPLTRAAPGTGTLWILKPAILLVGILRGPVLAVGFITLMAALFVLLPILDRSGHSSVKRRILVAVPFLLWMAFLALSLLLSTGVPG